MKIEMVSIDELVPYEKNAKLHPQSQIDLLVKSIQEYGFTQPVVIDKKSNIVIGHGRCLAAKQAGITKVPVLRIENLSDTKLRQLRLLDNKISETGWDIALVNEELLELSELPDFDVTLTGFVLPSEFEPELPNEMEISEGKDKFQLRVDFANEDEQQMLFVELRDRGFKVKV